MDEGPLVVRTTDTVTPETVVTRTPGEPTQAFAAPVVETPQVVESARTVESTGTTMSRSFSPDAMIASLAGVFLLVVGLVAMARAGFDGGVDANVVDVLGFSHTALLGIVEGIAGLLLLLAGLARWRGGEMFFGLALAIAGIVGGVQTSSFEKNLALESTWSWILAAIGGVVALAALALPRYVASHRTVRVD